MPKTSKTGKSKVAATITHGKATRTNIPRAEHQALMAEDDRNPIQIAYERRNRDLDPQLARRGKDHQDWSDPEVQAMPLFIRERVHPKVLINDLPQRSTESEIIPSRTSTARLTGLAALPGGGVKATFENRYADGGAMPARFSWD